MEAFKQLVDAVHRAEEQNCTDEDRSKLDALNSLYNEFHELCVKRHKQNGGPLSSIELIRATATILGMTIRANRTSEATGMLIAITAFETILSIATQEGEN